MEAEIPTVGNDVVDYSGLSREELELQLKEHVQEADKIRHHLKSEVRRHRDTSARLNLISRVVENAHFAVMITDADQHLVYVNEAYTRLTGLKSTDVVGRTPKVNQSGRHGPDFYQKIWRELNRRGVWRGEVWDRRPDGSFFMKYLSIEVVRDEAGAVTNYFAIFSDLSEQKRTEEELERLTHYDPLTELPNRILFRNRLGHEFNISNRHQSRTGLLVLNLDRFRMINDAFGFAIGDDLLVQVAERLKGRVRSTDLLARQEDRSERDSDLISRIGGDDFSFILSELRAPEDANVVARRLLGVFDKPFDAEGEEVFLSGSIGIAVYPDNARSEDGLMQCAEAALNMVKAEGKGGYRFFSDELNRSSAERVRLEARLHRAVANEEFTLHYQPKLDFKTGKMMGMEALLRWPQDDGSMVPPGSFIPLTEDTGLINPIGRWIILQAMQDTCRINQETGLKLQVAINLSVRQFLNPGVVGVIQEALQITGIDPSLVEFEITESMLIDKVEDARQSMDNLRDLGVKLAIDDFGTGYSSLSYLKEFPVNTMKIDRSFIAPLQKGPEAAAIVGALVSLGKAMGLNVVAEGIENQEQQELVASSGCDLGQGFHIARPMPLEDLIAGVKKTA
ncbi:putative bifunctional diguanylate cyclase/phosphodiesterase [Oceanospirillum sanctuarii]|uniref:putative bifunctional diguanylate cyclase/phosphodiesterase n=1 Tax=Oceanospirillum sanctuarii TaxID=1434821 RepID=UPI000A39A5A8|nr:EAL domain-containing protein [Oceanospirillum sanctuarii]